MIKNLPVFAHFPANCLSQKGIMQCIIWRPLVGVRCDPELWTYHVFGRSALAHAYQYRKWPGSLNGHTLGSDSVDLPDMIFYRINVHRFTVLWHILSIEGETAAVTWVKALHGCSDLVPRSGNDENAAAGGQVRSNPGLMWRGNHCLFRFLNMTFVVTVNNPLKCPGHTSRPGVRHMGHISFRHPL